MTCISFLGAHKSQIIFNAYPVQSRRCKVVVTKAKVGPIGRSTKKTERDMLREMKAKRMKKKRKMDLSASSGFDRKKSDDAKANRKEEEKKKVTPEDEILEKKRLMEAKLGHTVRVGAQTIVDADRTREDVEMSREIEEKLRIMEEELGRPVVVRRGRAATATALEAPKTKRNAKLTKEEEMQQKKELMQLVLGTDVHVQQVHIEDVRAKN